MSNATTSSVLIVGSMAFDDLQFPFPITDPADPSQKRTAFTDVVGGSCTYAALTASCFAPVQIVAVVGEDFPAATLKQLASRAIDTAGVEHAAGNTFRWSGRYHTDMTGRDTLDTQLNVFADFQPKLPADYRHTPLVLLGNIHPALQLQVLDQMQQPKLVMADTMNFWIEGEPALLTQLLKRIDVLVINDEEARLLSGESNIARAAKVILQRGPKSLIIKRGEHGALYFDAEGVFAAPALLLEEVADPTGAGDCFAGGLLGYLATQLPQGKHRDHHSMRQAMLHGTATASYCVEALGTAGVADLTRDQVQQRVQQIRAMYRID